MTGAVRKWLSLVAFCAGMFLPCAGRAQDVLIREIASREFSIHVGGVESDPVKEVASREYSIHIENGSQDLVHEVVSREYDVLITSSEPPPAVTPLVVTPSPTGESVTLDWSGYNQWAVKDIVRFDIYLTDSGPFSDVAGMTPVATIGAGATGITLNDLTAYTDHYIAVVAVDGLGNRTTAVNYSAAYILSPQTISREFSLFIGQEPEPPYKEVVSREYDIVITSPEPPPAIPEIAVTVSPVGDTATLDWSAYNQWAVRDILRFDIYLSDAGAFGSVAGMTPVASAGAGTTSIILTGLTPGTDHFFAVVPVDALGNYDADVTYSAAYVLSPQVISREFSLFIGNEPPVPRPSVEDMPLANFSFESPDVSNWIYWGSMSAAQKTAFAWTGGGNGTNGPALYNNGSGWNYTNVPDGAQGVSLQGDATLSITVDFPAPGDYYLEWNDASRGGQVNPYEIRLGTRVVSLPFSTSATAWRRNALRFTVSAAGSATLTFAGLNPAGGDNSVGIDNVSLGRVTADGVRPSPEQRELASREYSIVVPDDTIPAPVTGTGSGFSAVTSSAAFGAVDLDWTSYNEAVQTDVVRYRVYVGTAFFDTVTGLTPYEYVQTGQQRHTVTGLNGLGIYHFAVVAEDILGNFDPSVRSFSAQASISGVGEAVNLAGVSGRTSLSYTWAAPPDAGAFLQGYRIHFGGNPPVQLPATATSWEATALLPGTGYPFRITTLDAFGGESAGVSLLGSTWLPNPANVRLVARNGTVVLQWDAVQPAAVVGHYAVYRSGAAFTDVTTATRISEDPATEAVLGTFSETTGRHYAVATVNSLGGMDPAVVSISATKLPQTITFPALTPGPLSIPLTATASSGLPVVFFSSPSSVASVEGANLVVHRGGTVTVTAAQDGNAQFWAASASQTLRLPPVITGFRAGGAELVNGALLTAPSVVLDVTALDAAGVVTAEFFRRAAGQGAWTSLGLDNTPGDGWKATLPVASLPDGNYDLLVTVRTLDGSSASRQQSVALALAPVLTLTLGDTIVEGSALNGTVSIGRAAAAPVTVTISSSRPTQLNPGPPVTIPAGQTSAPFSLQGTQDIEIEGPTEVRITASTPGAADAQDTVTLLDDDWPQITLTLDRSLVSEADGSNAAIATITRDPATARPLTVWLRNSSPAAASLPAFVEIAAGSSSISFPVGAVDDTNSDGTQTANLKAEVRLADGTVISESPTFPLQVGDDEGPRLELSYPPGFLIEGSTGSVTVRRSGGSTAAALSVSLTALPTGQLTLPASVSIPAGAAQATFNITGVSDAADGSAPVRVSATAASHSPAQTEIVVTDLQKPDLTVADATAPPAAETESLFTVSYRLENKGPAAAAGPFVQRILLSTDPAPGNDILLAQSSFTTSLDSGAWLERSESVRAPREAGTYWVLVTADASGAVDEILETNNTVIAAEPITVGAAYTASVQTSVTRVPANTPIPLTGSATKAGGLKVPFVMVNIHIRVAGTERVIAAITNAAGDFSTTWRPLPGEGGDYEIGAAHPGVSTAPTQDTFAILTAKAEFPTETIVFEEASSVSLTGTISNPTAYPLTGLSLTAVSPPSGLTVNTSLASASLAPGLSQSAGVSLSAAAGYFGDSTLTLRLSSAEGVTIDIPLRLSVRPLLPKLSANPSPIAASVLRGSQKSVTFTVTNSGGAATGPLRVLMPVSPWIQLASPETLESIPPEGTAEVTLLLAPSATEALTLFNGSLVLDPATGASLTVPFAFRVVSGQTGNLQIEAVDESYYFTAEAPKVSGATVTLRDAISAEQINVQTTGADGRSAFLNIAEGWYNVEVDTPNHTRWSGNIFVNAGETTFRQVFISREWVTYTWKVEEIEIQDRYRISVETTFETNVPAPVVTVEPSGLDVDSMQFYGGVAHQNFHVTNHGLIAAKNASIRIPEMPGLVFDPLITELGDLPAKSSIGIPTSIWKALPVHEYFVPDPSTCQTLLLSQELTSTSWSPVNFPGLEFSLVLQGPLRQTLLFSIHNKSSDRIYLPVLQISAGNSLTLKSRGIEANDLPILPRKNGIPELNPGETVALEFIVDTGGADLRASVCQLMLPNTAGSRLAASKHLNLQLGDGLTGQDIEARIAEFFAAPALFASQHPDLAPAWNEFEILIGHDFARMLRAEKTTPDTSHLAAKDAITAWILANPEPLLQQPPAASPPRATVAKDAQDNACAACETIRNTNYTPQTLEAYENYARRFFESIYRSFYGQSATEAWLAYLNGDCDHHASASYSDGSEIVEGYRFFSGFKNDSRTKEFVNYIMDGAEVIVQKLVDDGEITCSPISFEINYLFESKGGKIPGFLHDEAKRLLRYDNGLSIPGNMAGDISSYQLGPNSVCQRDDRNISGTILVEPVPSLFCTGGVVYRITGDFQIRVDDALDFCPGGLGDGIEQQITTRLQILEAKCAAGALPFTVTFHPLATKRYASNPKLKCDDGCCRDFMSVDYHYVCGETSVPGSALVLVQSGSCQFHGTSGTSGGGGSSGSTGAGIGSLTFVENLPCSTNGRRVQARGEGRSETEDGVCARVKLRLDQDAVLTRTAFKCSLSLNNERDDGELRQVGFEVNIRDTQGLDASNLFSIRVSHLEGLDAIDGSDAIPPSASGLVEWTVIPRDGAAPLADTDYEVGGTISYELGGIRYGIPVSRVRITVKPDAALYLKYFHQRDVFSDDPFTVPVEPSQPFSLAVMVENRGAGAARRLSITSAQPEIVDNEKGLLIDFQIIGTEVAGQNLSPSLSADFGDVPPGQRRTGTWLMTSSLQGLFIDYKATFEHLDGFGDPRLSLIKEVEIHEMIHMVEALGTLSDGQPDFLVNDVADIRDLPDTIHLSDGTTAPVALLETATASGAPAPGSLSVQISAAPGAGWTYLRIPDPANGAYRLTGVQRSDGLTIPVDKNAWVTDRTFIGLGRAPVRENILHLVDFAGTGLYTLTYEPLPAGDTTAPVSAVAALPAQSAQAIPVTWSGTDASGIVSYDLFYRVDGGAWQPWLTDTVRTFAIFNGTTGRSYGFYSIATDAAGNREAAPAAADATTTVSLTNAAPVVAAIPAQSVQEGQTFEYRIAATDPDGQGSALSYALTTAVPGIVIDSTGLIRWVTGESDGGRTADVTVSAMDGESPGASGSTTFRITVSDFNSPPLVPSIPPQSVAAGTPLALTLTAEDGDVPAQTITFSLGFAPPGMNLTPGGTLTWSPPASAAGQSFRVEVLATDSGSPAAVGRTEFTVSVLQAPDRAPVFSPLPVQIWFPGETGTATVTATDPEGQPVTLTADLTSLAGAPGFNAPGNSGTGTLTWPVPAGTRGTFTVPLTASDGVQQSNASLIIRVEPRSLYWEWAAGALAGVSQAADIEMLADPDGDGTQNVFEMTFLQNPLRADQTPVDLSLSGPVEGNWYQADLSVLRRRGAHQLVQIVPQSSRSLKALSWSDTPATDFDVSLDPEGDRDSNASTEEVRLRFLLEISDNPAQQSKFLRLKSVLRNTP